MTLIAPSPIAAFIRYLLKAKSTDVVRRILENPEAFVSQLKDALTVVAGNWDVELRLRQEVYATAGQMIASATGIHPEGARYWIEAKSEGTERMSAEAIALRASVDQAMQEREFVLKAHYREVEHKHYERVIEVFLRKDGNKVQRMEDRAQLGWDSLPEDVQESFMTGKKEREFRIA